MYDPRRGVQSTLHTGKPNKSHQDPGAKSLGRGASKALDRALGYLVELVGLAGRLLDELVKLAVLVVLAGALAHSAEP